MQTVVEGAVSVFAGGDISIGRARGGDLSLSTTGGSVSVGVLVAQADIRTAGGPVTVDRLTGRDVVIASAGGAVTVNSLFCERLTLASGGGDVSIRSLRVEQVRSFCPFLAASRRKAPFSPVRPGDFPG